MHPMGRSSEHTLADQKFPPHSSSMDELNDDWWIDAVEEDVRIGLPLDGDGGLWSSGFIPPPPRPPFLEEITPDGLTTCDLCTWARHSSASFDLSGNREVSWLMTLVFVSLLSALIGAIVMITVIRCRNRLKHFSHTSGIDCLCLGREEESETPSTFHMSSRSETNRDGSKELDNRYEIPGGENRNDRRQHRVWSWLSRRASAAPAQLGSTAPPAADNHYTVEEAYPSSGEALYAELDRESCNSPAYQNTAYNGFEVEPHSAPSSAYYSDLSCAPSDRTYEAVGPPETAFWDSRRPVHFRLSAIREAITVPSDYV